MAKVGKVDYYYMRELVQIPVYYSPAIQQFYCNIDDVTVEGAREFAESQGIVSHRHIPRVRAGMKIFGDSQKDVEVNMKKFMDDLSAAKIKESKVIMINLQYKTETQLNNDWMRKGRQEVENPGKMNLDFEYKILIKKEFSGKVLYYGESRTSSERVDRWVEVPYSEEMMDMIKLFSQSFDKLIDLLRMHFDSTESVLKLAGKNILENL
jgi:hypothetical protein